MLKLNRVVVPLSLDCNLHCKYCYRKAGLREIPEFNDLMRNYLSNLQPSWCNSVTASGGEPLLHFDKVKELFSYVPPLVHKKIMTNCVELTQEMVDYFNEMNVEVCCSHDGEMTKYLRGIDILKEPDILALIKQLNNFYIFSVCTKFNNDPYLNYLNTSSYFDKPFNYNTLFTFEDEYLPGLMDDFDFSKYVKGYMKLRQEGIIKQDAPQLQRRKQGFNVLPDGTVVGMSKIHHTYGTIENTMEELIQKKRELGDFDVCESFKDCSCRDRCCQASQLASKSFCKGLQTVDAWFQSFED